jgi:hypothetical protein
MCRSRGVPAVDRRLRGLATVEIEYATESLTPYNTAAGGCVDVHRNDELVVEPLVSAFLVIMRDEFIHELAQMALTQRDNLVQTLAAC